MHRLLPYLFAILAFSQNNCTFNEKEGIASNPDAIVVQQIIRAQFCTLAKLRGIDKQVFPNEQDTSSWSYALTSKFTGRENQDSTVKYITAYLAAKHLPVITTNVNSVFRAGCISLPQSVKFAVCNAYHHATVYGKSDPAHQHSGPLAISRPISINDSLRLYYYEFGKYPSAIAGFSVLRFTKDITAEPVYESRLWTTCGPN